MASNQQNYMPMPMSLGNPPDCNIGRRAIPVLIDFSLGASFKLDLSALQQAGAMDSVQTLYVDNSANTAALTITMGLTNQKIIIPANAQAYIPILQGNPPVIVFSVPTGTPVVNIDALNFFVPPYIWYSTGMPVVDTTLAAVISNNAVNVTTNPATISGPTDASGTIAAGGTAQLLSAANATRKRFVICNPSSASEVLQFSYGNTGHMIDIPIGATWNESDLTVSGDAIYIKAATTGHAFTAYTWP